MNLDAPCELVRDLREPEVDYHVVWCGATWRDFPQPEIGTEPDGLGSRDLMNDMRAYLKAHPTISYMGKNLARAIKADSSEVQKRLCKLWNDGEVTREQGNAVYANGKPDRRWVYQWKGARPRLAMRSGSGKFLRVPKMSLEYRTRLEQAS